MRMMTGSGYANLQYLRAMLEKFIRECDDAEDKQTYVDLYWDHTIRSHIRRADYAGAWRRIQLAALGPKAFEGLHRICKGHVENERMLLTASPVAVMGYVHVLFHCLVQAKKISGRARLIPTAAEGWDRLTGNGNPVADLLRRYHGLAFIAAAMEVGSIVDWVNNRRFERPAIAA